MIAMAAAMRLADAQRSYGFSVAPRWELRTVGMAGESGEASPA